MPAPDPNAPDSIVLGQFSGLKNTVAPERLQATELQRALNIDIDDSGQPRRRRGRSMALTGSWHSIKGPLAGKVYGVRDGYLGIIRPAPAFYTLGVYIGDAEVCYTEVGDDVYFSSRDASGVITLAETVLPWGQTDGQGTWFSPVYSPTDTLGEVAGSLLGDPPKATQIEAYKGRIYLATGKTLWTTELFRYHYVDRTKNYMLFEHDTTLVMAVDDGLYVGTTGGLYFLQGVFGSFKLQLVIDAAVLPGSGVVVPTNLVHPQARSQDVPTGLAIMCMTEAGAVAGLNGGETYNLTQGRVEFPAAVSAAGLYREDQGAHTYVAAMDSAGAPAANAHIGDYVEAEIRRFPTPAQPTPLPSPIAVSDFQNGIYSIGGVAKTFADMWVHSADWGAFDPASLIPGVGMQLVQTADGDSFNGPVSTPELFAAIGREFIGVAEYTLETTGDPTVLEMFIAITVCDVPGFAQGWEWYVNTVAGYQAEVVKDFGSSYEARTALPYPQGNYKSAYMFCEEGLATSLNGGPVTTPAGTPQANLAANTFGISMDAYSDGVETTTITLRSITFYAEGPSTILPRLSA